MAPEIRLEQRLDRKTRYLVYLEGVYAISFSTKRKAEEWVTEYLKWSYKNQ